MNNPERINDEMTQEIADESGQKNKDEGVEIANDLLEQVAGGGNGTVLAYS
jgi:hypothetical protein